MSGNASGSSPIARTPSRSFGVAEIGEIGLVELQIAAAAGGEVGDLFCIDAGEVGEEVRDVGIGGRSIASRPPRKCTMLGEGMRHLGRRSGGGGQEGEVLAEDRSRPSELAGDGEPGRREVEVAVLAVKVGGDAIPAHRDALEPLQEVEWK